MMQDLRNLLTLWFKFKVQQVNTPRGPGFRIVDEVSHKQFKSLLHLAEVHDCKVVYGRPEYVDEAGLYVLLHDAQN